MEEINLKELFGYIKEKVIIIAIMMLVILVVGCVYSIFLKTPLYRSSTTIVLVSDDGTRDNADGSYTQSDVQLNKGLVSTYSEIVKSRKIVDVVIKNLSLDYTIDELLPHITVSVVNDTEIIRINVIDPDKTQAADIANEIVKVFGEEIKSIYKLQNVSTVDVAEESEHPYNINLLKDIITYILVGSALSLGIIFLIYYFDSTIKNPEEIENKLVLPVLGVVPKVKKDKK